MLGLGWIINSVYTLSQTQSSEPGYQHERSILKTLATSLRGIEDPHSFVDKWNNHSPLVLGIFDKSEISFPEALAVALREGNVVLLETTRSVDAYIFIEDHDYGLTLNLPKYDTNSRQRKFELLLTLSFYIGIICIVLLWLWPLVKNLQALRKTALSFGQGQFKSRVDTSKLSYIRDIETEFNRMADKIESLISDNKLLSRAVSHDLKTPLARLRFGLDALAETENQLQREKYVTRVNRDLEEMEDLIDTLLQYARLDDTSISLQRRPIVLHPLLDELTQNMSDSEKNLHIYCENKTATINGDLRYLTMLFNNVLSNAQQHAKHQIEVHIKTKDQTTSVCIEDDGEGIPENERENVTKPFWRGQSARDKHQHNRKGHGMGLAIVERIAQWHEAQLKVGKSNTLGGASVTLTFHHHCKWPKGTFQ